MSIGYTYEYDRYFKARINGTVWTCYLVTQEELDEAAQIINEDENEEGVPAMVVLRDRVLMVAEGAVSKGILAHELLHISVDQCHLASAEVSADALEEVIATMLQYDLDKFIRTRNSLYRRFKKLEENL